MTKINIFFVSHINLVFYIFSVDSDTSNIKVKKLNRPLSPTTDTEVKKVYKEIQKGGDVPIGGLGIPYPEKKGTAFYQIKICSSRHM